MKTRIKKQLTPSILSSLVAYVILLNVAHSQTYFYDDAVSSGTIWHSDGAETANPHYDRTNRSSACIQNAGNASWERTEVFPDAYTIQADDQFYISYYNPNGAASWQLRMDLSTSGEDTYVGDYNHESATEWQESIIDLSAYEGESLTKIIIYPAGGEALSISYDAIYVSSSSDVSGTNLFSELAIEGLFVQNGATGSNPSPDAVNPSETSINHAGTAWSKVEWFPSYTVQQNDQLFISFYNPNQAAAWQLQLGVDNKSAIWAGEADHGSGSSSGWDEASFDLKDYEDSVITSILLYPTTDEDKVIYIDNVYISSNTQTYHYWVGASSSDWATTSNWFEAYSPAAGQNAWVTNDGSNPSIGSDVELDFLNLADDATLLVTSGNTLTVNHDVFANTGYIEVEYGASLVVLGTLYGDHHIINKYVEQINITSDDGLTEIPVDSTLQLYAEVLPEDATDKDFTWSVTNGTGTATISEDGLLTAEGIGSVTIQATADDGSNIADELEITIGAILVDEITITSDDDLDQIPVDSTLQLYAAVLPEDATNQDITWSVNNGTGAATISDQGLLAAESSGTVTVVATAVDDSGVTGEFEITIYTVPVAQITITSENDVNQVVENGTLQLYAEVTPSNATETGVTWSVTNGTGTATISDEGLLLAVSSGTIAVIATAADGSDVTGEFDITIVEEEVLIEQITVTSENDSNQVSVDNTLQLYTEILPEGATNKAINWSVTNGTGTATISDEGLVLASSAGTITVTATAADGSNVTGEFDITIMEQEVLIEQITVTSENENNRVSVGNTLQLFAEVLPEEATNKTITWSVSNGTGTASISQAGLLNATGIGSVTAQATADDGSNVAGELEITIEAILVNQITITSDDDLDQIPVDSTLQLFTQVFPENATDKDITWSVTNGTGMATISDQGLLSAESAGTVTAIATANDASGVLDQFDLTIVERAIPVAQITITSDDNLTSLTVDSTLQLYAAVLPENATDQSITWSITNETGTATISENGLLTSTSSGNVIAVASANDGSGVEGQFGITIVEQIIKAVVSLSISPSEIAAGESSTITVTLDQAMGTNESVELAVSDNIADLYSLSESNVSLPANSTTASVMITSNLSNEQLANEVDATITLVNPSSNVKLGETSSVDITLIPVILSADPEEPITLYPNPVADQFIVNLTSIASAEAISTTGVIVSIPFTGEQTFDVSNLTEGLYIICITTLDGDTFVRKILKR